MSDFLNKFEEEEEVDYSLNQYLTFIIDKRYYAYPIKIVKEIIEMQDITEVPEFPEYSKGVINLRGTIIPIIDVRLRFHKPEAEYTEKTCIIVVYIGELEVGFIVDTVDEVLDLFDTDISAAPAITSDRHTRYIEKVGKKNKKIIMILDATKMLNDDDLKAFEEYEHIGDSQGEETYYEEEKEAEE